MISGKKKKKVNKYNLPSIQLKTIEILQSSNTNRHNQYSFHLKMWSTIQQLEKLDTSTSLTHHPKNITKNLIKMIVIHFN